MREITCAESEKYDRNKLAVGASYTFPHGQPESMTEWGTSGNAYIPIVRDLAEYESAETMKIVKCTHYLMEPADVDSDWQDEELQEVIDNSVIDELREYQKVIAELKAWRHEIATNRAKRPKPKTLSQLAQSARDTGDIERITKILELRG